MPARAELPLDRTLVALGHPTRRAILQRLAGGSCRVTELAAPFDLSLNAVSKHARLLERAGLVRRDVRGRDHWLRFDAQPLEEATDWIERQRALWERRLDQLDAYLLKLKEKDS